MSAEPKPVAETSRLLCVGRFVEQKGHLVLIEAISRLVEEGIEMQIDLIGGGPMRAAIESLISQSELEDHVRLVGWKNSADVRRALESSRALVLASFAEGIPVVLMEAMALGRPVISTYVGGIRELVEPGESGWLVPAGNVDELTCALREVLATPVERLTQMGRHGREWVLRRHDAAREARKLASLIVNRDKPTGASRGVASR
jgi:glycosyltransferase involved in cell wall biosynthesis